MTTKLPLWLFPTALAVGLLSTAGAQAQSLASFALLAGSTITNTGVTTINGNIGLAPGSATTGLGGAGANRIVLTGGALHINNGVAIQAKSDLTTAYNLLMGRPTTSNLTGQALGNLGTVSALNAGVYSFDTSAQLNGQLTLNGDDDDVFIFQIGSTLTTAPGSSIVLGGTVRASNVFFVVGSSATIDTTTAFQGQILALASITLNNSATISCGAAWARNGAITLDTNTIGICVYDVVPGTIGEPAEDETANEREARLALNDFVESGGELPLSFAVLALLTPAELAEAFRQLNGEIGTTTSPAAFQAMNSYLDVVFGRLTGRPGTVILEQEGGPDLGNPADNTISVMGYASTDASAGGPLQPFAEIDSRPMPSINEWTIWGAAYGGISGTSANDSTGAHATATQDFGFALGFDRHVSADTLVGFSIAAGGTNFDLDESFGSGRSAMLQAALYAHQSIEQAYLSAVVSYARHQNTTNRIVTMAGNDQYRGEFASHSAAAGVEAGYELGWFTPFVAARGQLVSTPGYSESTVAGNSTFALDYDGRLALSARTEIGARFDWSTAFEGGTVNLTSSIAWAHTIAGANSASASYQALGAGSRFTVVGTTPASDSILLSAGMGANYDNGFGVSSELNASLAANTRSYGASVRLGKAW